MEPVETVLPVLLLLTLSCPSEIKALNIVKMNEKVLFTFRDEWEYKE